MRVISLEEPRENKKIRQPVAIFVGLGFPREIDTVFDAFQILNEWSGGRGEVYQAALQSCRDALAGSGDETPMRRQMFEAFATRSRHTGARRCWPASARRYAEEWLRQ